MPSNPCTLREGNGKATAKNGCSEGCGVVVGLRAPGSFAGEGLGSEGRGRD